jgi:multidrug efflux pump subunit AcrA (membrane-fusion protein)
MLTLGVAVFVFFVRSKEAPQTRPEQERVQAVRVIEVAPVSLVPRAVGFGYIRPELVWEAVAEVQGKIVEMNPELRRGSLLAEGELLMRIDPAQRITAKEQIQAEIESILARLQEIERREANLRNNLEIERRALEIAAQELERRRRLVEGGTISESEFDRQEQQYLTQKNRVQELENQLNLLPAEANDLRAQLSRARSRLEDTRLDIEKTVIRAPFDARVAEVMVEMGQAVNAGAVLARLDSIGVAEALAEFPLFAFRNILPKGAPPLAADGLSMQSLRRFLDVDALVRLTIGNQKLEWTGRLVRVREEVDPATRTIGAFVAVDEPYLQAVPGERPPLLRNMYCEVELRGQPIPGAIVIPRSAVRGGRVSLVGPDGRLILQEVEIDYVQGNLAVIASGLAGGETLVVSDLVPAVEGMLLEPRLDAELAEKVVAEATARPVADASGIGTETE